MDQKSLITQTTEYDTLFKCVKENNIYVGSLGYAIKMVIIEDHKDKYDTCYTQLRDVLADIKMRKD